MLASATTLRSGTTLARPSRKSACGGRGRSAIFVPVSARGGAAAAAVADGRDPTGLSSLRFAKPSAADMDSLMSDWRSRSCNHDYAGASVTAPDLPQEVKSGGFMISKTRKRIGEGKKCYEDAVKLVKSWKHLQLGWNCTTKPPMKAGTTICSATQTVVPWSVLPAQVVYCNESSAEFGPGNKGKRFALGLCSLNGHQLAGEERFQVEQHSDGSVWYDVYLFSRPDTLLAWASLPVVKIMQLRYVNDSARTVAAAMKA